MSAKSIANAFAALTLLAFQMAGSPAGSALDQLERAVRRPLPKVPPPVVSRPDTVWVPGRWVDTPAGLAHVPGHWEERRSAREFIVPPEAACTATGNCVFVPGGVRPPAMERQGP